MSLRPLSLAKMATGALLLVGASVVVFFWGKRSVVREVYRDERKVWAAWLGL